MENKLFKKNNLSRSNQWWNSDKNNFLLEFPVDWFLVYSVVSLVKFLIKSCTYSVKKGVWTHRWSDRHTRTSTFYLSTIFFIRNHLKLYVIVSMRFVTWNGMSNALKANFRLEDKNTIFVRMPFLKRSIFFWKVVFSLKNVQRTFSWIWIKSTIECRNTVFLLWNIWILLKKYYQCKDSTDFLNKIRCKQKCYVTFDESSKKDPLDY